MLQRLRFVLLLLLIASWASASPVRRHAVGPPPTPHFWDSLTPGPLAIGFKALLLRAQASEFTHGPQHFVQIGIWYPCEPGSGTAMTFRDYLVLKASDNTLDDPAPEALQSAIDEFPLKPFVNSPMIARQNAVTRPNPVRSPIVYIAQGNGQVAADQAVLAEFIASHGYIVVTTPSVMSITGPLTSDDQTGPRAEEQSDDIDRAVSGIGDWPNAVNVPVSVIGYDFGVDALALYVMHHPVNAFVSLDANTSAASIASLKSVPMFDPTRSLPPILNLYETSDHPAPDLSFLNAASMESQAFPSMRHIDFTTIGFATRSEAAAMAQTTLDFLERVWAPNRPH